jgi:hypothetical protein
VTELVNPTEIEQIVGARRLNSQHLGRAVSAEQRVYILHSGQCFRSGKDLRECPFSLALDRGIDVARWADWQDRAVQVVVRDGTLVPMHIPRSATLVRRRRDVAGGAE